uniref:Growth hormone receptor b n=1 Tax=Takifugu rubripes TaxID=31033 RepID=H2U7S7_TAKRU
MCPQINSMAAAAAALLLFSCLHAVPPAVLGSALHRGPSPHITSCVSANMETFHCRWNVSSLQSGDLRLFYINKKHPQTPPNEWRECPHYSAQSPNECFFDENHTTVWTFYTIQLRSGDQSIIYDENIIDVADIVQPDPPQELTWTLLNQSVTSTYSDIMLSWKPPESADVEMGWLRLLYEVQYRNMDIEQWQVTDLVKSTSRTLYGLKSNVDYEVRVRCKTLGGKAFGEFSDSVFVHIPSKVSHFPALALLIFGALCVVAILMLVAILQQEKLMVLLLPPVPGPRIRGVDSKLLKKGKLRELTSILGSPLDLRSELYNNDPWVEFIDLDIEETTSRLKDLDPDCLMQPSLLSDCTPPIFSFRDDDSGRASCCDPDLSSEPEASTVHPAILNQVINQTFCSTGCAGSGLLNQTPNVSETETLDREALYTQVSEVRSTGKVLLSPELEKISSSKGMPLENEGKDLHILVVNAHHGSNMAGNVSQTFPRPDTSELFDSSHASTSHSHESDATSNRPAPAYTVVDGVSGQNSLLLATNSTSGLQLIIPKSVPTSTGYLTPDLLGSITP